MDLDYLMRRMTEERQRAADADNAPARQAHFELAEHYAVQIERLRRNGDGAGMQALTVRRRHPGSIAMQKARRERAPFGVRHSDPMR